MFGVAVAAFRNSMVFHKLDNLTSISIHLIPLSVFWNLRWNTLKYEQSLSEEQRYFITLKENESFYDLFITMFIYPLLFYLLWVLLYSIKVFVISSKKIQERQYETMYVYYKRKPGIQKILGLLGPKFAPVIFMSGHIALFLVSAIVAIAAYLSYTMNTIFLFFWITLSIWNGANFYMEYFSKKYELNLKKLEEI